MDRYVLMVEVVSAVADPAILGLWRCTAEKNAPLFVANVRWHAEQAGA
jgi:hypothetical protein